MKVNPRRFLDTVGGDAKIRFAMPSRYPILLLSLFLLWWSWLAVAPLYRQDWLLENALVFVSLPLLVLTYPKLRLSNFAYTMLFVFFSLHAVGAHYTYAEVPYQQWSRMVLGFDINDVFGWRRNHFDRLVHLGYGLLVTPAAIEVLDTYAPQRGIWRFLVPWLFMISHGTLYETIEWGAAEFFGGDLGQAYLGTQGDVWDSQKDTALAGLGALISVALCRWGGRILQPGFNHPR